MSIIIIIIYEWYFPFIMIWFHSISPEIETVSQEEKQQ